MTPSIDLYELIKSLTKSEKKNFKLLFSQSGSKEESNYFRLFREIERMEVYDETQIKKIFGNEPFIRQLTATKYYLYNLILKSLVFSLHNKPEHSKIASLDGISVLFEKKLYYQILKLTEQIKRKAKQTERYTEVIEAISWEERTISYLPLFKNAFDEHHRLYMEKMEMVAKISNQALYQSLKAKVFALIKDDRFFIKENTFLKNQQEILAKIDAEPVLSNKARCDMYYILGTLNYYNSNFEQSKTAYKEILSLLDKHVYLQHPPHSINFLGSAQNYLVAASELTTIRDAFDYELIERLKKDSRANVVTYMMIVRLELLFFTKREEYQEATRLIIANKKYEKELLKNDFYVVNGYLTDSMLTFFWNGNYNDAIKRIYQLTTFYESDLPFDLILLCKVVEFLIHFKLGNVELLKTQANNLERLQKSHPSEFHLNIDIFKLLIKHGNRINKKKEWNELDRFMQEVDAHENSRVLDKLAVYFNFRKWISQNILNSTEVKKGK